MKRTIVLLSVCLSFLLLGCYAMGIHPKEMDAKAKSLKPGDKALVYFFCLTRCNLPLGVYCDGVLLGETDGNRYIYAFLDPGEHLLVSDATWLTKKELPVSLEAGRTYYFQQAFKRGLFANSAPLVGLDEAEGLAKLSRCGLSRGMDGETLNNLK